MKICTWWALVTLTLFWPPLMFKYTYQVPSPWKVLFVDPLNLHLLIPNQQRSSTLHPAESIGIKHTHVYTHTRTHIQLLTYTYTLALPIHFILVLSQEHDNFWIEVSKEYEDPHWNIVCVIWNAIVRTLIGFMRNKTQSN